MFGLVLLMLLLGQQPISAQENGGAGVTREEMRYNCLSREEHLIIREQLQNAIQSFNIREGVKFTKGENVKFHWPIKQASGFHDKNISAISNYVDHNENFPGVIRDYNCGARSYDTENGYNHTGIDIFPFPYDWDMMEKGQMEIVAAAPGTIVLKAQGNQDKSCSFNSSAWNAVYVLHDDGTVAWYGHMKRNSATPKKVGERVEQGEFLGVVGSSGNSTGPHLHFEIQDSEGRVLDPYQGACNPTVSESLWEDQLPYYQSRINRLMTHAIAPNPYGCYGQTDPNAKNRFQKGQLVYFATYFVDQRSGQTSSHRVLRPDGTLFQQWTTDIDVSHYSSSYWFRSFQITESEPAGLWTFTVDFEDMNYEHTFEVVEFPPPTNLAVDDVHPTSVELSWQDINDHEENFEIQRSKSASSGFAAIANITSNNTSFADEGLDISTTYYYRLRSHSADFTSGFSEILEVTTEDRVAVYPIPTDNNLSIVINDPELEEIALKLINPSGQTVLDNCYQRNAAQFMVNIDMNVYTPGLFLLVITQEAETKVLRVVKK